MKEIPGEDFAGPHWRYRSCPLQMVTATVTDWAARRAFLAKYPQTQVPFAQVPTRDRAFDSYYDHVLAEFRRMGREGNAWAPRPPI